MYYKNMNEPIERRAAHISPSHGRYDHRGIHIVPDFEFVLKHSIASYRCKIEKKLTDCTDPKVRQFEEGMPDILAGIEIYLARYINKLEEAEKTFSGAKSERQHLICTLKKVLMQPAESFYEAFIACNAVMFLSTGYEAGQIDDHLFPY